MQDGALAPLTGALPSARPSAAQDMGLGGFLLDLAGAGSLIFRPPAPTYTVTAGPDGLALVLSANARWCALPSVFLLPCRTWRRKAQSSTLPFRRNSPQHCLGEQLQCKTAFHHCQKRANNTSPPAKLSTNCTCTCRKRKFPACVVARLQTARGGSIIAALVEHQAPATPAPGFGAAPSAPFAAAAARRPTILLSHGTAVDLGRVLLYYRCASS